MNRKERRKVVHAKPTGKDLDKVIKQEGLAATRKAVDLYSVAVAYTLYNKLHFGSTKILTTMKQIEDLFDSINKNYLDFVDMKQVLKNEIGLDIKDSV